MKRIFVAIVALALIFGCLGTEEKEQNLIPDKANGYVVIKLSDILSDKQFMESLGVSGEGDDFQAGAERLKNEAGFDIYSIGKMTLFFDAERFDGEDAYGAMMFSGEFQKDKILSKVRESGKLLEEQYGGVTLYRTDSAISDDLSFVNTEEEAFAFVDSKTFVMGSYEALKDVVDVKNGKRKPMEDKELDRVSGAVNKESMLFLAMKAPSSLADAEESLSSGGPFDASSLAKMTYSAFSYDKKNEDITIRLAMLFKTESSAEKVRKLAESLILMAGLGLDEDSASMYVLEKIQFETSGDMLSVDLSTTVSEIDKVSEELQEMAQQMTPEPVYPEYEDEYYYGGQQGTNSEQIYPEYDEEQYQEET